MFIKLGFATYNFDGQMMKGKKMTLNEAELGKDYIIKDVDTQGDEEMESFLFSLGCYSGESITVVDKKRNLVEVLCEDPRRENWKTVKPRLYQINRKSKKGNKNGNSKRN